MRQFKLSTISARSCSFKQISLAEAAETFNIPTLLSLFRQHLHEKWACDAVNVIWGYKNEFKADIMLQPHNKVTLYMPDFYNPEQMSRILLNCSVDVGPGGDTHRWPPQVIWVRVGKNTDVGQRGRRPTFPILYFCSSPLPKTSLYSGMIVRTGSWLLQQHHHFLSSLQAWVDRLLPIELAVVVGTHFKHH
jgi:hypothetical protein